MSAGVEDAEQIPDNGDISFCFDCGTFAIFDDTFPDAIRKPTPSENFTIKHDKELARVLIAWQNVMRKQKR
jgi:hypothetical protein